MLQHIIRTQPDISSEKYTYYLRIVIIITQLVQALKLQLDYTNNNHED